MQLLSSMIASLLPLSGRSVIDASTDIDPKALRFSFQPSTDQEKDRRMDENGDETNNVTLC